MYNFVIVPLHLISLFYFIYLNIFLFLFVCIQISFEYFYDDCLVTDEEKVSKESDERPILRKDEVETVFVYIQSWSQR